MAKSAYNYRCKYVNSIGCDLLIKPKINKRYDEIEQRNSR